CAVLRRAEGEAAPTSLSITAPDEAALLKVLAKFPEKVSAAIADYEPSVITRYILDVAAAFNRFYHNCQILSAEDPDVRATRVAITRATNVVLGNAFPLICMKKMEKI
ncbi:MAG: arginine--tRNA ligase, partial [Clostridia bacterium]|nr:arginine--tRNA ligase [Clostridia bacterium]